jgi:hypothetical protein
VELKPAAAPVLGPSAHQLHITDNFTLIDKCAAEHFIDELGFVPLSKTGAELLFEMLSQRYERGSTMVTSNLPF